MDDRQKIAKSVLSDAALGGLIFLTIYVTQTHLANVYGIWKSFSPIGFAAVWAWSCVLVPSTKIWAPGANVLRYALNAAMFLVLVGVFWEKQTALCLLIACYVLVVRPLMMRAGIA